MSKRNMIIIGVVASMILLCLCAGVIGYFAVQADERNEEFAGIFAACDGVSVAGSATFDNANIKAMGIQTDDTSDYSTTTLPIPDSMRADTLAETSVVLCINESERVLLESCDYYAEEDRSDLSVIERYQFEQTIFIVETQTGQTIARTTLQGDEPDACSDEEFFDDFETLVVREGDSVSDSDMQVWFEENITKKK